MHEEVTQPILSKHSNSDGHSLEATIDDHLIADLDVSLQLELKKQFNPPDLLEPNTMTVQTQEQMVESSQVPPSKVSYAWSDLKNVSHAAIFKCFI